MQFRYEKVNEEIIAKPQLIIVQHGSVETRLCIKYRVTYRVYLDDYVFDLTSSDEDCMYILSDVELKSLSKGINNMIAELEKKVKEDIEIRLRKITNLINAIFIAKDVGARIEKLVLENYQYESVVKNAFSVDC